MKKPCYSGILKWRGEEFKIEIFEEDNFSRLKDIKQAYGFIFDKEKKLLIIKQPTKEEWGLPGGTPEKYDKNWEETLRREVIEEADVEIKNIKPLFYITSKCLTKNISKGKEGTMLRAIAEVNSIKPQTIDPATGDINKRKFIRPKDFLKYCPWEENGKIQLELALRQLK